MAKSWKLRTECPESYKPKLFGFWSLVTYMSQRCIDDVFTAPPWITGASSYYITFKCNMDVFIGGIDI